MAHIYAWPLNRATDIAVCPKLTLIAYTEYLYVNSNGSGEIASLHKPVPWMLLYVVSDLSHMDQLKVFVISLTTHRTLFLKESFFFYALTISRCRESCLNKSLQQVLKSLPKEGTLHILVQCNKCWMSVLQLFICFHTKDKGKLLHIKLKSIVWLIKTACVTFLEHGFWLICQQLHLPVTTMILRLKYIWATTWQNQQNDCTTSEDSVQPGHPPSPISLHCPHKEAWVLSYPLSTRRRQWLDWADAQADPSLRWAHSHFVGFVMSWLIYSDRQVWAYTVDPDQTAPEGSVMFVTYIPSCKWAPEEWLLGSTDLERINKIVQNIIWASSREKLFWVSDQVRLKPACSATETSYSIEILDLASICILLSK